MLVGFVAVFTVAVVHKVNEITWAASRLNTRQASIRLNLI